MCDSKHHFRYLPLHFRFYQQYRPTKPGQLYCMVTEACHVVHVCEQFADSFWQPNDRYRGANVPLHVCASLTRRRILHGRQQLWGLGKVDRLVVAVVLYVRQITFVVVVVVVRWQRRQGPVDGLFRARWRWDDSWNTHTNTQSHKMKQSEL